MKPVFLYDDQCGFCSKKVDVWKQKTGDAVEYKACSLVLSEKECRESVHMLIGEHHIKAAQAVFRLWSYGGFRFPLWCYMYIPGFAWVSECVYRIVAKHRKHV